MRPLILASSSPYRRELLQRLQVDFQCHSPAIDESPRPGEAPAALAARLAAAKATAVGAAYRDALVIGSDQVASLDGRPLGKPGDAVRARAQLAAASGRVLTFHTGLCLLDVASGERQQCVETFRAHFRTLNAERIERYLEREQPFDCAGSFRAEGLGIALFRRLEGDDPNALVGLPLIRLVTFLERAGAAVI